MVKSFTYLLVEVLDRVAVLNQLGVVLGLGEGEVLMCAV